MSNAVLRFITGLIAGTLFCMTFVLLQPIYFSILLFAILAIIIIVEWKYLFNIHSPLFWLVMPLYPVLPFVLLIVLNQHTTYHHLLAYLFILVFSFDTGGYIVGSLVGKHKIAPSISPGKSWEGFFGGYIFSGISLAFIMCKQGIVKNSFFILWFTLILSIVSLCGDLFESWLKRRAQVKDSGNVLPGHGGFLDRFDGVMLAVFVFYMLKDYLVTRIC